MTTCDCGLPATDGRLLCARCYATRSAVEQVLSNLRERERAMRFDSSRPFGSDSEIISRAKRWAAATRSGTIEGNLLVIGPYGSGKTHLARAIWRAFVEPKLIHRSLWHEVLFVSELDWFARQKKAIRSGSGIDASALIRRACDARVLFWDDFGRQPRSEGGWADNLLLRVFDHRYNAKLPTVITSNLDLAKPLQQVEEAVRDRITGGAIKLYLVGDSRRQEEP